MTDEIISDISQRLRALERENAERKPVMEVVKLLMYFLIGISVVLGLFGLKQFSDINTIIQEEVSRQFPKDQQSYLQYAELIQKSKSLSDDFENIYGKYNQAFSNYSHIDKVSEDFDIEGKVLVVISESTDRYRKDQESEESKAMYEEPWRSTAISTLELLSSLQKQRSFDSDFIFNAAQCAGRLKQNYLAFELMKAASEKRPNDAPVKAGMLSSIVDIGTEQEINDSYLSLLNMVENLTLNSPHIVLSEAWNATEDQRRYPELIIAINNLRAKNSGVVIPSYAYAVQAMAYMRASQEGATANALSSLALAKQVLSEETGLSQWAESTLLEIKKVERALKKTELIHALTSES